MNATSCTVVADNASTEIIKTTLYCLIMVTSLAGNSLVIAIIYRKKRMRTTTNIFIANMAVSDLLFPFFAFPKEISEIFLGRMRWVVLGTAGEILCKAVNFFQDISTAVSIQSLVVIAVDRFHAVNFPLRPRFITAKKSRLIVAFTWFTAMVIHSPYFYTFRTKSHENQTYCISTWKPAFETKSAHRLYAGIIMTTLIFIPIFLLVVLYSLIAVELVCQRNAGHQSNQERERRDKENRKVLKQVLTVVLLFISCIMPFTVFMFFCHFVWLWDIPCGFQPFFFPTKFIIHSNAALNPFIYFIFNQNYRKGFKEIVSSCNGALRIPFRKRVSKHRHSLQDETELASVL